MLATSVCAKDHITRDYRFCPLETFGVARAFCVGLCEKHHVGFCPNAEGPGEPLHGPAVGARVPRKLTNGLLIDETHKTRTRVVLADILWIVLATEMQLTH